jgi:endonuclease/exonuclease/phosphatase family metal-dependent hydrolase
LATSTGRTAQAAVVKFRDDVSLAVASVHLDAFDAGRRLVQAQEMVAGLLRVQDKNVVLAGDLNFDVALVAQGTADHDLYRFLTREMVDAAKHAGSTTIISRRLDYVFYRSVAVRRVEARVLQDKRVKVMDHDPLLVELSL